MVLDIAEIEFLYSTRASYSRVPSFSFLFFFFFLFIFFVSYKTFTQEMLTCLPLVIVVSTKLRLPISPKLQHFHETCQVKENGKHIWPKCHPSRPKEKKHEFGLHVKCCYWPSSLTIHEEHLWPNVLTRATDLEHSHQLI